MGLLLVQLPAFENVHMLSMSRQSINAASFSPQGNWIALGCAALGQLLVWEWRSESYVLKQQGHHYDVSTVAFSPDGAYIATGADDNKVGSPKPSGTALVASTVADWYRLTRWYNHKANCPHVGILESLQSGKK